MYPTLNSDLPVHLFSVTTAMSFRQRSPTLGLYSGCIVTRANLNTDSLDFGSSAKRSAVTFSIHVHLQLTHQC